MLQFRQLSKTRGNSRRQKRIHRQSEIFKICHVAQFCRERAIKQVGKELEGSKVGQPGNIGGNVAGEVVGGEVEVPELRGEPKNVVGDGTYEAVLREIEVLEVGAVVEECGEGAWDVIILKIEVG